jgi:hypothetical protein
MTAYILKNLSYLLSDLHYFLPKSFDTSIFRPYITEMQQERSRRRMLYSYSSKLINNYVLALFLNSRSRGPPGD